MKPVVSIIVTCPKCSHVETLTLEVATPRPLVDSNTASGAPVSRLTGRPLVTPSGKVTYCACGHPRGWHKDGSGECEYGCGCTKARSRRQASREASRGASHEAGRPWLSDDEHQKMAITSTTVKERGVENGVGLQRKDSGLSPMATNILRALAERAAPLTKKEIAITAGKSSRGGAFASAMSELRLSGYVLDVGGGRCEITGAGLTVVPATEPLPKGEALLNHYKKRMTPMETAMFAAFVASYPAPLTPSLLREATDFEPKGGAAANGLAKMRALGLLVGWRASDELMARVRAGEATRGRG